jgi:hypothetical protein
MSKSNMLMPFEVTGLIALNKCIDTNSALTSMAQEHIFSMRLS